MQLKANISIERAEPVMGLMVKATTRLIRHACEAKKIGI
jgi:hypothetical protein